MILEHVRAMSVCDFRPFAGRFGVDVIISRAPLVWNWEKRAVCSTFQEFDDLESITHKVCRTINRSSR